MYTVPRVPRATTTRGAASETPESIHTIIINSHAILLLGSFRKVATSIELTHFEIFEPLKVRSPYTMLLGNTT